MSTDTKVRTESLWVLCNLISSTSADELLNMLKLNEETNGEIDLFYPLCNNLTSLDKGELQLLLQMIKSLERLLKLDESPLLKGASSIKDIVQKYGGLEALQKLQHHANQEIYLLSHEILVQHFAGLEDDESIEIEPPTGKSAEIDMFTYVITSPAVRKAYNAAELDFSSASTNHSSGEKTRFLI